MEHRQSNLIGPITPGLFVDGFHASIRVGGCLGTVGASLALRGQVSVATCEIAPGSSTHFPVSHP